MKPFLLVQLSDPHVGADWGPGDSVARLAAAVDAVRAVALDPDAVLVSGDLADHALDAEYEQVRELLAPLEAPLYALPGNHDDRVAMRRHFGLPGSGGEPVEYAVDLGPVRLVVLDSTKADDDRGALDADRLAWLDETLAAAADMPTLVAVHHAPVAFGIPALDELGLPRADRQALGKVLERHPQVRRVVAGHTHRTVSSTLGGRSVLAAPSTYVQARLDFAAEELELSAEPRAFAVHACFDGDVFSHVQPVPKTSGSAVRAS